jgi:hypothetical protein
VNFVGAYLTEAQARLLCDHFEFPERRNATFRASPGLR